MPLDKNFQAVLISRMEKLSAEELNALDAGIDENAALIMLYKLFPEIDFILLKGLHVLQGHQYQPERALDGDVDPQGQSGPEPMPMQMPQQGGALGGLTGANPPRNLT
jgi:hypothetical protein